MKKINHTMPDQMIEKLREEQLRTGLSASEIIRRALDVYFETNMETEKGKARTVQKVGGNTSPGKK